MKAEHWKPFFEKYVVPNLPNFNWAGLPELNKDLSQLILDNGQWIDRVAVRGNSPMDILKKLVRVRHNLFHGGKDFSADRDLLLVKEGIQILEAMEKDLPDYYKYL